MASIFRDLWGSFFSETYNPSVEDVFHVKTILHKISSFPLEIIDAIIDLAEYWPHASTVYSSPTRVLSGSGENRFMLRSFPLGFVPTSRSDYQLLSSYESSYISATPHPYPGPHQIPQDISKKVIDQLTTKFPPRGEHPCRKIVFTIKSHDQGWGGSGQDRGTYFGSYTWFDVGREKLLAFHERDFEKVPDPRFRLTDLAIEYSGGSDHGEIASNPVIFGLQTLLPRTVTYTREDVATDRTAYLFDHPLLPDEMALQKNVTSTGNMKEHIVTWTYDDNGNPDSAEADELKEKGRGSATGSGEMLRSLEVGDVVTIWAKARFPGWTNVINEIAIDVYWAV